MKILANRKSKIFIMKILFTIAVFTAISVVGVRCFHPAEAADLSLYVILGCMLCMALTIVVIRCGYFREQDRVIERAEERVREYMAGSQEARIDCSEDGALYRLFHEVNSLAAILNAHMEKERNAKEFLKNTISDISHQLKTPLAALEMYQEIMEAEPDNAETVKEFSKKIGTALKRMEQLILSMLKITRLDTGNIIFEKQSCPVKELIKNAISELGTRAVQEEKQLIIKGTPNLTIICDMDWTSEAIGNLVKNALDHTEAGGTIRITWKSTPTMLRILVSDNGSGIAPEDIHHIFKRFYRSKFFLNTPGIGLGLPLAKSIIEGQGGVISVQSVLHEGTTFSVSFLTKS